MYNTVGETAGVTQDVGSDPTVRDGFCSSRLDCVCCVFCGMVVEEGEEEEEEWGEIMSVDRLRGKGVNVMVLNPNEMEDADADMDGEPDTTER